MLRSRVAGVAAAVAATLDLVLSAGGCVGRYTGGLGSCGRLRRTAVRWSAARLAICWGDCSWLVTLVSGWLIGGIFSGVGCSATLGTGWSLVFGGG